MVIDMLGKPISLVEERHLYEGAYSPIVTGRFRSCPMFARDKLFPGCVTLLAIPFKKNEDEMLLVKYMHMRGDITVNSIGCVSSITNHPLRMYVYAPELLQTAKELLVAEEEEESRR